VHRCYGVRRRSDLDPEQFYEAIARCAMDIFGVTHNSFKSATIVNKVLSWYKRSKARLKREKVRGKRGLLVVACVGVWWLRLAWSACSRTEGRGAAGRRRRTAEGRQGAPSRW
jgi:hypothetical protein